MIIITIDFVNMFSYKTFPDIPFILNYINQLMMFSETTLSFFQLLCSTIYNTGST
jgi:hypothetical protein